MCFPFRDFTRRECGFYWQLFKLWLIFYYVIAGVLSFVRVFYNDPHIRYDCETTWTWLVGNGTFTQLLFLGTLLSYKILDGINGIHQDPMASLITSEILLNLDRLCS